MSFVMTVQCFPDTASSFIFSNYSSGSNYCLYDHDNDIIIIIIIII
jgi:hypothetical protein